MTDSDCCDRWEKGRVGNAVVGKHSNGGTVVTVATTDWSHGLKGTIRAVTGIPRNIPDRLGV